MVFSIIGFDSDIGTVEAGLSGSLHISDAQSGSGFFVITGST